MTKKQIELKIESKLISKITNHRLMTRETFKNRHKGDFPDVNRGQCAYHINELRIWLRIAQHVDKAKNMTWLNYTNKIEPYETYYAKQLTK
jgi:hypothetical protein